MNFKYLSKEFSLIENSVGIDLSSAQTDLNIQRFKDNKKLLFVTSDGFEWIKTW